MYKAIIFDLDGTLANTLESIAYSCNECLEQVGLKPRPVEEYKAFTGDGTEALIRKALSASGDQHGKHYEMVFKLYTAIFEKNCTYRVTPYEGIAEMLVKLKESGMQLAVLTNKKHERAITVVEHLFGKNVFKQIIGQSDNFPVKPNPAGAIYIAEQFGCTPEQCIFVGDTEIDIETGKNAGMYTVGVLWGFREKEIIEAYNPHAMIEKPSEIISIL